jgi:hypothetical protein
MEKLMRKQIWSVDATWVRSIQIMSVCWFGLLLLVVLAPGCEDDVRPAGKLTQTQALDRTGVTIDNGENVRPQAQPSPAAKQSGPIIGQRTTDIRNAAVETKQGDSKVVQPQITAKDYIALQGNAYVSIIGRLSVLSIQHAMDMYRANNDRYPKDYDEFMTEIIRANNIALPQLPTYQKYGYDEREHKLVIFESQTLKDQPASR